VTATIQWQPPMFAAQPTHYKPVIFYAFMTICLKTSVVWNTCIKLHFTVHRFQCFGETFALVQDSGDWNQQMEATGESETLVHIHHTRRCHIQNCWHIYGQSYLLFGIIRAVGIIRGNMNRKVGEKTLWARKTNFP
jgi:hypothetical protein